MKKQSFEGDHHRSSKPRRGPRKRQPNPEFGKLVASIRKKLGLTQLELARMARVSPKTVVRVEETGMIRSDALIRICAAMNQPTEEWLKLAGHQVSRRQIEDVLAPRPQPVTSLFPRLDPAEYFDQIGVHLKEHKAAVMISVITSPVAVDQKKLVDSFGQLIKNGLRSILVCPYPVADPSIAQYCPGLNTYYSRSYDWACDLAGQIEQVYALPKGSVPVFCPRVDGRASITIPPIRVNDLRPAVIKYAEVRSETKLELSARYAVGVYVRPSDGKSDIWVDIFDGQEVVTERVKEAKDIWISYLGEIADTLLPSGEAPNTGQSEANLMFWKRMR